MFVAVILSPEIRLHYIQVQLQITPFHRPVGQTSQLGKCIEMSSLTPFAQHNTFQLSLESKHVSIKQGKPLPFLSLRTLDAKINNTGPRSEYVLLLFRMPSQFRSCCEWACESNWKKNYACEASKQSLVIHSHLGTISSNKRERGNYKLQNRA